MGASSVKRIENNPVMCSYTGGDHCPSGVLLGEDARRFNEMMNSPPQPTSEKAKETIRRAQELARRFADVKKDELEAIHDLLKQMEWVGDHTDYEDSWAVTTCACPCCRNAKTDGHKPGCILKQFIDKGGKNEETVHVRNLR